VILHLTLALALAAPTLPTGPTGGTGGDIAHHTLPSGVELFLFDDPSAPSVKGSILIDAGSELEPADRVGLVRVLSDALWRGGGGGRSAEEVDAWFGAHGGDLNVSRDRRALSIDFFCRPDALVECLELQRDILAAPNYGIEQVADARQRLIAVMSQWASNPQFIANRGIYEVAYGERVTGRRILHDGDSAEISREDVLAFHRAHVGSNRLRIALFGALPDDLPETVEALFAELKRTTPAPSPAWPAFRREEGLRVVVLDVPDAAHTELRVGIPSVALGHADAPALQLWSTYNAKRGQSRELPATAEQIRAGVLIQFSFDRMITAGLGVETEAAALALRALVELFAPGEEAQLDAARLATARTKLDGLLRPSDGYTRVRSSSLRHLAGRSDGLAAAHAAALETVPADEVLEAVRRHTQPGLVAVLAGPAETLAPLLAPFGAVEVRRGLRQPRGTDAGLALRDRVLAVTGGSDRWAALDTLVYEGQTAVPGLDEPVVVRVEHDLAGGRRRIEQVLPGAGPTFTVSIPESSWSRAGEAYVPIDAGRHATLRRQEQRQVVQLLRALALGRDVHVDAGEGQQLLLQRDGEVLAWLDLDDDGLPLLRGYEADGSAQLTEIRGWVESGGLRFPGHLVNPGVENVWHAFAPNAPLEPVIFVRPVR
jgi:predicted Zn-dependent peptidase